MIYENDIYIFKSSGRIFASNNGIIGIDNNLAVYEGYDRYLIPSWANNNEFEFLGEIVKLKREERVELANHMIDLWTKWKDKE